MHYKTPPSDVCLELQAPSSKLKWFESCQAQTFYVEALISKSAGQKELTHPWTAGVHLPSIYKSLLGTFTSFTPTIVPYDILSSWSKSLVWALRYSQANNNLYSQSSAMHGVCLLRVKVSRLQAVGNSRSLSQVDKCWLCWHDLHDHTDQSGYQLL